MKKVAARLAISAVLVFGGLPLIAAAESANVAPGSLIKGESTSAVYYVDEDMSRHVFPNGRIFMSWFENFDGIVVLTDAELAAYPLAGNIPYKPGKVMVKLQSDPRTYAVDEGGTLRWVKSEAAARALYGADWNRKIEDLSDAFFVDYQVGADVDDDADFERGQGSRIRSLIDTLRSKRLKKLSSRGASGEDLENRGFGRNKVAVCHKSGASNSHTIYIARPALPAHLGHGDTEGRCAGDVEADTTAPTITSLSIGSIATTSARVIFTANESVTAKVYLSTTATVDTSASATPKAVSGTLSASHDILLSGLTISTLYHYRVVVADEAGNATVSSEGTFTTLTPDTTAPTILSSSVGSITASSAHLIFTANESVTAKVYSATSSPVDASATATPAVEVGTAAASHDILFSGLVGGTTYYVRFVAKDQAGNETTSSELSFTTL